MLVLIPSNFSVKPQSFPITVHTKMTKNTRVNSVWKMTNRVLKVSLTFNVFPIQRIRWLMNSLIDLGVSVITENRDSCVNEHHIGLLGSRAKDMRHPHSKDEREIQYGQPD